ncbi:MULTISPECIES: hypothetical protein [unclassified Leucobacter]|uniref:hypothetical protein n=1 Tax=unclassified Leucobacter TaxID=2621730 RepID=UPI0012E0483A|nr:hypothetical protein [Leucobacter sp. Ag1]
MSGTPFAPPVQARTSDRATSSGVSPAGPRSERRAGAKTASGVRCVALVAPNRAMRVFGRSSRKPSAASLARRVFPEPAVPTRIALAPSGSSAARASASSALRPQNGAECGEVGTGTGSAEDPTSRPPAFSDTIAAPPA